jgi:hypothetical protein
MGRMNRRFFCTTGVIGVFALVVAGMSADIHAQHGGGIGHASIPTNAGQGKPATAGRPETASRPAGSGKPTTTAKPDSTQRPTIADQLAREHGLAIQLQKLFPDGTDLTAASDGFKNLGQFVAAAHVAANNANFTFDELKSAMLSGDGMTLGAAIHALDPGANAEMEATAGQNQAAADLKAAAKQN